MGPSLTSQFKLDLTGIELAKRMLKMVFCQTLDLDLGLKMLIILELNVVLTPNQAVNSVCPLSKAGLVHGSKFSERVRNWTLR